MATTREKLELIARLFCEVFGEESGGYVKGGVSDMPAFEALRSIGAPTRSMYYSDGSAIDVCEQWIGGVHFEAQSDRRPMTDGERAAHLSDAIAHKRERLNEQLADLDRAVA